MQLTLFCFFFRHCFFRTVYATLLCAKNVLFLCRTIIWEILFPLFSLSHFYFLITHANYFEGIKPPCNPMETQPLVLWGEKEIGGAQQQRFTTLPLDPPTFKFKLFNISHLLEVVVIRRRKIIRMDPDRSNNSRVNFSSRNNRNIPESKQQKGYHQ